MGQQEWDNVSNLLARVQREYQNSLAGGDEDRETKKENSTRQARVELTYISRGIGQRRVPIPIRFPIPFRTPPMFTTGSAVRKGGDPKLWHDPIGNAGVRSWIRDGRGYYVGAHIWIRVDVYPINPISGQVPTVEVVHYLCFSATAVKDLKQVEAAVRQKLKERIPNIK